MARLSTTDADTMLNASVVAASTYYLALFTTDPGTTGASGEVTGGSYARQVIQFGTASAGSVASSDSQLFTNLPIEAGVSVSSVSSPPSPWASTSGAVLPRDSLVRYLRGLTFRSPRERSPLLSRRG